MQIFHFQEQKPRGTDAFPVAYYHVDSRHPQYQMPCHWHVECELVRVLEGVFTLRINEAQYTLCAGDSAWIGSGALHTGTAEHCVYECLVFRAPLLNSELGACRPILDGIAQSTATIGPLLPAACEPVRQAVQLAFSSAASQSPGYALRTIGALYCLLGAALDTGLAAPAPHHQPFAHHSILALKKVLARIEQDYAAPLTLEQLAAEAGLSRKYFCHFFAEMTHRTPIDYLNWYRTQQAAWRLAHTAATVTETAYDCGFNDLSYFIRAFKKYKGVTPKQYAKQHAPRKGV